MSCGGRKVDGGGGLTKLEGGRCGVIIIFKNNIILFILIILFIF